MGGVHVRDARMGIPNDASMQGRAPDVSSRLDEASPVVYPPCMHDPLAAKYAKLVDPGIRRFMIEGERFYPPDAVSFTLAEQRAFYDRYCAHFGKPRPSSVTAHDFNAGSVPCRLYKSDATPRPPVLLYLHGGGLRARLSR